MRPEGPKPPALERIRMPLRIASVFIGYVIYLVVPGPTVGRIFLWAGFIVLDWSIIDVVTKSSRDRDSMMVMAQGLLGTGLIIAGVILVLR